MVKIKTDLIEPMFDGHEEYFQPGLGRSFTPAFIRAPRTVSRLTPCSCPIVANDLPFR
jgi:hypothetical protein